MSVKPEGLLGNIKIANVFHHPVRAWNMNFNPYIYILYYQSILLIYLPPTPSVILIKWNISFVTEVLGQPGLIPEHNVVAIPEWRHTNVDKQRSLLADVDVTLPLGAV